MPKEEIIGSSILIIDDDDELGDLIKVTLLPCEDEVQIATTGEQGLELAEEGTPDLIMLSLSLPDMDGWTVFSRLKAMPDLWGIPIVLTDSPLELDCAHARAVGAAGCLAKPYSSRELLRARDTVLRGRTFYPSLDGEE